MDDFEQLQKMEAAMQFAGGTGASPNPMSGSIARTPNLRQRAAMAVNEAKIRLADVERAVEILNQHPELEELLNIMQRSHF